MTPAAAERRSIAAAAPAPARRARVLVVIDQAKGFINFVAPGAFDALRTRHDVQFAALSEGGGRMGVDPRDYLDDVPWQIIDPDRGRAALWQRLATVEQLRLGLGRYRRRLRRMRLLALRPRARLGLSVLALPGVRPLYAGRLRRQLLASRHAELDRLIERSRPDVVVHPSTLNSELINDLLLACTRHGIPSVVLMDSWDNPSTKNATIVQPDWLLVWGEQTRRHAVAYMGLPAERVVPLGAPQLEVLRAVDLGARRAAYRAELGLGGDETVVLYAGAGTLDGDFDALAALEAAIETGALPPGLVLYRPYINPQRQHDLGRIREQPWRHVRIQERDTTWRQAPRLKRAVRASRQVESRLAALAAADVVVSPLSTILLEAAMVGRAVVCQFSDRRTSRTFRARNAPLVHFDDFLAIPEAVVAEGDDRLAPAIRAALALANDAQAAARLRAATGRIVAPSARPYGDRLADFVDAVVRAHARGRQ
jgi:hypothetical protein